MFTRSRQPGTPQRNQGQTQTQSQQQGFQGQQSFQGNYQAGNQQNQQNKQQGNNTPFKQQAQQQQMPQQQQQARMPQQQQQMKQQQQQQQMMKQQQVQQQQPAVQQQQQQQQPGTPQQAQRLKPILKSSTPAVQQNQIKPNQQANNGMEFTETQNNENSAGDAQDGIPKWRRKVPGLKVNRKLKRLRMNQRLRKQLQPKNAIMVLNEMKSGVQFTFPENPSSLPGTLFLVHANVDGKVYVGQGISKILARQNAAENALKSLLLEKMTAAAMKATIDAEHPDGQIAEPKVEKKETNADGTPMETNAEEQDEIPWSSLASFALYKLFVEWQNQGTVVPITRPGATPAKAKPKEPKAAAVPKDLPANALSIHPVMLLNQMKPGLTYVEVGRTGVSPNITFTLGVDIDGREFTGSAKNKKDAKKQTAKAALQGLYNLVYPEESHTDEVMTEVA